MKIDYLVNKLFVLYVTGVPGLIRVGFVLFMERSLPYDTLGKVVSDMSVVQLASFFTAIGWSGVVMGLSDIQGKEKNFVRVFYSSAITLLFAGFFVVALGYFDYVYFIFDCLFFLISWTLYQITRHFSLYDKSYAKIALSEGLVVFVMVLAIYSNITPLVSLSLGYVLFFLINIPKGFINNKLSVCSKDQAYKSWNIATSNFLLGLGVYSLPIVVGLVLNKDYAALVGVAVSILMLLHLIPRAVSNHYLPEISKKIEGDFSLAMALHLNQKRLSLIAAFVMLAIIVLSIPIASQLQLIGLLYLEGANYIFFLLAVNVVLTVIGLPITDMFNSIGGTKYTAIYTYLYGALILFFTSIFVVFGYGFFDLILLLVFYALAGLTRLWLLERKLSYVLKETGNAAS